MSIAVSVTMNLYFVPKFMLNFVVESIEVEWRLPIVVESVVKCV